jgi:hypothetical protein
MPRFIFVWRLIRKAETLVESVFLFCGVLEGMKVGAGSWLLSLDEWWLPATSGLEH